MTIEGVQFVYLGPEEWQARFASVAREAELCQRRQTKAALGDRHEISRYSTLCTELETLVRTRVAEGALSIELSGAAIEILDACAGEVNHPWRTSIEQLPGELFSALATLIELLRKGGVIFELRDPLKPGSTASAVVSNGTPIPPAKVWRPPNCETGIRAVAARWESQLARAVEGDSDPLVPSGVSNRVLTEGLRKFVVRLPDRNPVDVRVVYRDGSEAERFPLGTLDMLTVANTEVPVFRVALLSMRHPEMDTDVDAAWLRNRDISQVRPAAETDMIVYETSRKQLADLARHGPRVIWLYQTGLEPAVIGFYRALVRHWQEHGGALAVVPHFYRRNQPFEEGTMWAIPS